MNGTDMDWIKRNVAREMAKELVKERNAYAAANPDHTEAVAALDVIITVFDRMAEGEAETSAEDPQTAKQPIYFDQQGRPKNGPEGEL